MEVALDIESKDMAECGDENVAPAKCAEEVVRDEVVFEGGGLRCALSEGIVSREHWTLTSFSLLHRFLHFFYLRHYNSPPSDLSVLCRVWVVGRSRSVVSDMRLNSSASYYMLQHAYLSQQPTGAFPLR